MRDATEKSEVSENTKFSYGVLSALVALSFAVGALVNRIQNIERRVDALDEIQKSIDRIDKNIAVMKVQIGIKNQADEDSN